MIDINKLLSLALTIVFLTIADLGHTQPPGATADSKPTWAERSSADQRRISSAREVLSHSIGSSRFTGFRTDQARAVMQGEGGWADASDAYVWNLAPGKYRLTATLGATFKNYGYAALVKTADGFDPGMPLAFVDNRETKISTFSVNADPGKSKARVIFYFKHDFEGKTRDSFAKETSVGETLVWSVEDHTDGDFKDIQVTLSQVK